MGLADGAAVGVTVGALVADAVGEGDGSGEAIITGSNMPSRVAVTTSIFPSSSNVILSMHTSRWLPGSDA